MAMQILIPILRKRHLRQPTRLVQLLHQPIRRTHQLPLQLFPQEQVALLPHHLRVVRIVPL